MDFGCLKFWKSQLQGYIHRVLISIVKLSSFLLRLVETYNHCYNHLSLIWENSTEFFVLFWDDLEEKCDASGQRMMWEYTKVLIIISFSFFTYITQNSTYCIQRHTLRSETIFGNWKPLKSDRKCFFSPRKLFSFSRYLSFCLYLLVMQQNYLIRKTRLISNFMTSQYG